MPERCGAGLRARSVGVRADVFMARQGRERRPEVTAAGEDACVTAGSTRSIRRRNEPFCGAPWGAVWGTPTQGSASLHSGLSCVAATRLWIRAGGCSAGDRSLTVAARFLVPCGLGVSRYAPAFFRFGHADGMPKPSSSL
jgi:hypothetical protein